MNVLPAWDSFPFGIDYSTTETLLPAPEDETDVK